MGTSCIDFPTSFIVYLDPTPIAAGKGVAGNAYYFTCRLFRYRTGFLSCNIIDFNPCTIY